MAQPSVIVLQNKNAAQDSAPAVEQALYEVRKKIYPRAVHGNFAAWRWIFVVTFAAAVYLDAFVGVVQAFQKLAFLEPLQGGPVSTGAQVAVLAIVVVLAIVGVRRFHPGKA